MSRANAWRHASPAKKVWWRIKGVGWWCRLLFSPDSERRTDGFTYSKKAADKALHDAYVAMTQAFQQDDAK